jgi:predicted O-linked N-acetylglucosamine transferase (SPINDLY family)
MAAEFDAIHQSGVDALQQGRVEEAAGRFAQAAAAQPWRFEAHYNLGYALHLLRRLEESVESYGRAIALRSDVADIYNNRGVVLRDLGLSAQALEDYDRAIALRPGSAEAHNNRGIVLREMGRPREALESYGRAVALRPRFAQAYSNAGSVLYDLGRLAEALQCQDQALAIEPGFVDAWVKRGVALRDMGRHGDSLASLERAMQLDPKYEWLEGLWMLAKMRVCDWAGFDESLANLIARVDRGERATHPFPWLALSGSATSERKAATIWAEARLGKFAPALAMPVTRPPRLRIGYFSSDFHEHATSWLLAGVLEHHDRSAFEVTAFSYGRDTGDAMRRRVAAAVERFVDVRERSDGDIAALSRELGIDIAVDLKGYTDGGRTGIFAARAAPIQVNFLGYPGTMAAAFIDTIVADATVIPEGDERHYTERVIRLPGCYQPNDTSRAVREKPLTREELGLPPEGFVFCCFNNNYKITPGVFASWMRVLDRVPRSVLWLLRDDDLAATNLRREAERLGIEPARIVFASRMSQADHLARYRCADLFLDTRPYNAHTTASDALWMGLPLVTCEGETFAARVASSILRAAGLPELVTGTPEAYEALAIELATNRARHAALRETLQSRRLSQALFDAQAFARKLEAAYSEMYDARLAGAA